MQMTDYEIKRNVLDAADQKAQITICADLNCCSEEKIKDILKVQGIDPRKLRRAPKKQHVERKPYKKPEIIPAPSKSEPAADKRQITVTDAVAAIKAQITEINRQQYELDMRKADLYKTIWDMLGEVDQ